MQYTKIALIGKIRSGKNTVGDYLIKNYGFKEFAFAQGIGEIIDRYFPKAWAEGKPRKHYQHIGQALRELDPDVWINYTLSKIALSGAERVVITDTRQVNEVEKLKEDGYLIIKVEADEEIRIDRMIKSGDTFRIHDLQHETEAQVDLAEADIVLVNNGTKEELEREVQNIINKLMNDK